MGRHTSYEENKADCDRKVDRAIAAERKRCADIVRGLFVATEFSPGRVSAILKAVEAIEAGGEG
jgi:hypothetical protein